MTSKRSGIAAFLENHPVFTIEDLRLVFSLAGGRGASDVLQHNKSMGRVAMIKEGLYYAVRPGQSVQNASVDPILVASKLVSDAVISFHTALDALGFAHSEFSTHYCLSNHYRPEMQFRHDHFRVVLTPEGLRRKSQELFCTEKIERLGMKITVTGSERTLVECLERPKYCGGFEEMYRSLEKIPFLRPDVLLEYLELREQKNLYARVGFFLSQHRDEFQVEQTFLRRLAANVPSQPVYWSPARTAGVLVKPWNLIVPESVRDRLWEDR